MSLFNKSLGFLLFSLIFLFGDWACAVDYAGSYRPYSMELKRDRIELEGLDEGDYARMSLDDIRLENAYISVFQSSMSNQFDNLEPEIVAALADLRKRGDGVTPMLLKLMDENQETGFESAILIYVPAVGTINIDPYLDYARKVLRERTQTMSAVLAGCASNLLAQHGTKNDAELMKWVMETRPWLADSVTRNLDELNLRLNLPKQEPRPSLRGTAESSDLSNGNSRTVKHKILPATNNKEHDSTPWIAWPLAILVAGGLLRLVLKKRNEVS